MSFHSTALPLPLAAHCRLRDALREADETRAQTEQLAIENAELQEAQLAADRERDDLMLQLRDGGVPLGGV